MDTTDDKERSKKIARLNDKFRTTFASGRVLITRGVAALGVLTHGRVLQAVKNFDQFGPDNDPHHEHDFGSLEIEGNKIFWKIDYYDPTLTFHSADPADPTVTIRVLTIMLAEEY